MANFQPSEDDIATLLMLSDYAMSRDIAIKRLKGNNNDAGQAVNEYFEDPSSEAKYRTAAWDESQFSSDRDGGAGANNQSFAIHGPDEYPKGLYDGAMSRPPSRTNHNKSPMGKIIDLTAEHAMANPSMSMSHQDEQDSELQQAISMSLQEQGLPSQEQGITVTEDVAFGPANRNEYEQGKWDMVPVGRTTVQEIMVDPDPAERKRDLDAPAFLKSTVANSRLNALVTIFHEIHMIRNIFLNVTDCLPNYGSNKEWWSGERIMLPSLQIADGPPIYDEIDRELQRLMAFLDKTDRSYGSVDVLANLDEVKRSWAHYGSDLESAVLQAWKHVSQHGSNRNFTKVIFSVGVQSEAEEDEAQEFAILELSPPAKDSTQETLYDIADNVLWPDLGNLETAETPYLFHVAEVIAFRIQGGAEYKRVDIPAVWYPDRYLKSSRGAALEMRQKKRAKLDEFERICKLEQQLTNVPLRSGKTVSVKDLFNASLKHDESRNQDELSTENDLMDIGRESGKVASKLSLELQKVLESIDKKLKALGEAKESACQELRNLSKLYTKPSTNPDAPQLHKYLLRGVSTSRNTMYVCRRAEPDLMDIDLERDGLPTTGDQWWHIHYAPTGSSPVKVEKITEEKVLDAAKNESNNTLLVYASEKALNFPKHGLPKSLETFVRNDNAYFKSELAASMSDVESSSPPTTADTDETQSIPSSPFEAPSPGKRKYEDDITGRPVTRRTTVSVSERELGADDGDEKEFDSEGTVMGNMPGVSSEEMLLGETPSLLDAPIQGGVEMQERSGMPLLGVRALGGGNAAAVAASRKLSLGLGANSGGGGMETIDGMDMDLDQVVQRNGKVREESAASKAVRRVGFRD